MLDEQTTNICRYLHGKTFSVADALRRFDHIGGGRADLAEVTRSALGTRDDRGDFRALVSDGALNEVGIGFPPYHGLCHTTTLAVV